MQIKPLTAAPGRTTSSIREQAKRAFAEPILPRHLCFPCRVCQQESSSHIEASSRQDQQTVMQSSLLSQPSKNVSQSQGVY